MIYYLSLNLLTTIRNTIQLIPLLFMPTMDIIHELILPFALPIRLQQMLESSIFVPCIVTFVPKFNAPSTHKLALLINPAFQLQTIKLEIKYGYFDDTSILLSPQTNSTINALDPSPYLRFFRLQLWNFASLQL